MRTLAFSPRDASTKTLSVTTTSAATSIASAPAPATYLVQAPATNAVPVFIEKGGSAVAAAVATGLPILPGQAQAFTVGPGDTHIAAIVSTGTATLYVTPGEGI